MDDMVLSNNEFMKSIVDNVKRDVCHSTKTTPKHVVTNSTKTTSNHLVKNLKATPSPLEHDFSQQNSGIRTCNDN